MPERAAAPRGRARLRAPAGLTLALLVGGCALLVGGCAWAEPANRRTWNLFEQHLVPEDEPAFSLALPLTAPGGLIALLLDVFIVHPIAVLDDAALQMTDVVWGRVDWDHDYWTECALAPGRGAATLVGFVGDWLVRVLQPVEPYPSSDQAPTERRTVDTDADGVRERALLGALRALPAAPSALLPALPPLPWGDELRDTFAELLASDDYRVRFAVHRALLQVEVPGLSDGWSGHRDPDPRVRALMLTSTRPEGPLPPALVAALLADPDPVVAALAERRLKP